MKPHYKLRIQIVMVTRGYGGERIFLRKSGETIEECWMVGMWQPQMHAGSETCNGGGAL